MVIFPLYIPIFLIFLIIHGVDIKGYASIETGSNTILMLTVLSLIVITVITLLRYISGNFQEGCETGSETVSTKPIIIMIFILSILSIFLILHRDTFISMLQTIMMLLTVIVESLVATLFLLSLLGLFYSKTILPVALLIEYLSGREVESKESRIGRLIEWLATYTIAIYPTPCERKN